MIGRYMFKKVKRGLEKLQKETLWWVAHYNNWRLLPDTSSNGLLCIQR